jgi:hypothetical protein
MPYRRFAHKKGEPRAQNFSFETPPAKSTKPAVTAKRRRPAVELKRKKSA